MKLLLGLILAIFTISTNLGLCEDKKPDATFPNDRLEGEPEYTNPQKGFENGKVDDIFLNYDEYKKSYKNIEKGNTSNIVKCPCEGKTKCTNRGCHVKPYINQKGQTQYRFIPVPTETDEQINPYFMMMSRQRLMANINEKPNLEAALTPVIQPKPELVHKSNIKFYTSISGSSATGSSSMTSTEVGGIWQNKVVPDSNGEITNFTLSKNYTKRSIFGSVALGIEKDIPLMSAIRFEIFSSFGRLSGLASNLVSTREVAGNKAYFNPSDNYGNMNVYQLGANIHIDTFKRIFKIYPSFGGGVSVANLELTAPSNASGFVPLYSLFIHLNYDISNEKTIFAGVKLITTQHSNTLHNNYTDKDLNVANTKIYNDRILYDRNIEISQLKLLAFEVGFRFY